MLEASCISVRRLMPRGVTDSLERKAAISAFRPHAAATMARQAKPHSLTSPCKITGTRPRGAACLPDMDIMASVSSQKNHCGTGEGNHCQARDDPPFEARAPAPGLARLTRGIGRHGLGTKDSVVVQVPAGPVSALRLLCNGRHSVLQCAINRPVQTAPQGASRIRQTVALVEGGPIVLGEPGAVLV